MYFYLSPPSYNIFTIFMCILLTKQSKDCKHFNFYHGLRDVSFRILTYIYHSRTYSIRRNLMDRCSRSINVSNAIMFGKLCGGHIFSRI